MARRILIYLAIVAGITAFSALFIVIFANSIQVSCRRSANSEATCAITTSLLGRWPTSSRVVAGVTGVQLDENCDDDCSYRAILMTSRGDWEPVNDVFTDESIVRRQVEAVRGFLQGSQPNLEYTEPVAWWVVALILGMDLIGLGVVVANFLKG